MTKHACSSRFQRLTSLALYALVLQCLVGVPRLRAQTCADWKAVVGWQGTYTLTASGSFTFNIIDMFSIDETSGGTVYMPTQVDGLCNQLGWSGADLQNTGSVNDSTQILNACQRGQWFTSDTLVGNTGYPSNSELSIDATGGTFYFQPISHDAVTHTVYNCQSQQSQGGIEWATTPADNWPVSFPLPAQVGPLTVTNYGFTAKSRYAGYQDINWTITFNLTPILNSYQTLTVATFGSGSVTSTDGNINCPGVCVHAYPLNTQVTLNAIPADGFVFAGWNGACSGTGPCTVTMTQAQSVNAIFSQPLQFIAVPPCRVVDTRGPNGDFGGPALQGGAQRSFTIPQGGCDIPANAQAYSLNLTVVPMGTLRYLTVWPTGENQPVVSTMNSPDGRVKANAAIVPAGTSGAVSFYVTNTTNLVVDIDGYFELATNGTAQYFALPPCRVLDTRGPNGDFGGPYLTGGHERDFPVQNSPCVPTANVVGALMNTPSGTLQPEVNYPAAAYAVSAAIGDLNGDGRPDLVTVNNLTNTIGVMLGNGNGTFQTPLMAGTDVGPVAVAIDDFNNDGKLDVASVNLDSNDVTVLLGKGDGTFQPGVNYAASGGPRSIASGDLNGDHKPDLVVANELGSNVSVLLGNGDGTFRAAVNYATGSNPASVVIADFNGDNKPDLAVANLVTNDISVLLGNGDGTFQAAMSFPAHVEPDALVAADFNHDGKMDLAVANVVTNDVSILLGNGNGTFQGAANYSAGANPTSLVVVDLNRDGKLDLAVANSGGGNIGVLFGNGNGTFQAMVPYTTGDTPVSVAAADLNGDGYPDLVVAQFNGGNHPPIAYSFNVTAVPHNGTHLGYLTVWPQGEAQPTVSTLNNPTGTIVANAAIVPAGSTGATAVFPSADTDLIVDINGYFAAPAGTGLSLYPFAPCRAFDSRSNNGPPFFGEKTIAMTTSPCAPPAVAQSYVLNATVIPPGGLGYLTLWPDGQLQPRVSTLNAADGFITSNMALVPTTNGSIDAYASALTQLLLDISGYFAP